MLPVDVKQVLSLDILEIKKSIWTVLCG